MRNNSLKVNAILNMIRRGSAILFPIITFSYASHKLGADGIGAYSFSYSLISYFLLLAALGISTYAVREGQTYRDDENELKRFVSEVYTINFLMTIVSYVILAILLLLWPKLAGYSVIIFILSVSIILTTIGADWINTLLEDYLFITVRFIVVQTFCLIMLFILVKDEGDVYKYAVIGMLSSVGGNLLNIVHIRRKIHFHLTLHPNFKKHLKPMLTLFSNSLAIKIYLLADVTILGIFMADKYVGYYSAASKVYTAVKEMINAMILVTVPRFSYYIAHNDTETYRKAYKGVYSSVSTMIIPCAAGLMLQAENVLYFLGGKDYVYGTKALWILSAAMIFAVAACLFTQSILIPNRQEGLFLKATVVSAITNIVLNLVLIPLWGIEAAALTTLFSEIIVCIMTMHRGRAYIDKIINFDKDIRAALLGTAGIVVVCVTVSLIVENRLFNMVLSIVVSCVVYLIITYAMNNSTVRKAAGIVAKRLKLAKRS